MSLRKGLILFILFAFAGNAYILGKSVDQNTIRSILLADKRYLLAALGLVFAMWLCDAWRFYALTRAAHERLSFKWGIILTWLHYFGCAVTPMQSGGGPFQVYVLYKKGISVGKGIAITLVRTMLTVLILTLFVPVALLIDPGIMRNIFLKGVITYVFVVIICTWFLIGYTLVCPKSVKRCGKVVLIWMNKWKFLRKNKLKGSFQWLDREMDNYSMNFKLAFSSGIFYLMAAVVLSVLHLLCMFSILPILMHSVNLSYNFLQTLAIQAIFTFLLYFIPTPGASGVAEGGGAFLFATLMPQHMAGIMAFVWRVFTEYISIFMGVVVVVRLLGWGVTEDLHKGVAPEKEAAHLTN